jgi:hypothetical protein
MVEGRRLACMARLTIVVLARQTACMTFSTGHGRVYTHNIMMLRLCGTGTTGAGPEAVIVTGCTSLWRQGVVTVNTICDRTGAEHDVVVLAHRCIAAGRCPERRIMAEFTAVGRRDIGRRTVAETTREI